MKPKYKKPTANPTPDAGSRVHIPRTKAAAGSSESEADNKSSRSRRMSEEAFETFMKEACGTDRKTLQDRLLAQATGTVTDYLGTDPQSTASAGAANMEYVAEALHAIRPQDGLEGLLATQMVGMHNLTMEFIFRAASKDQSDLSVESNLNRAVKAFGMLERLVELLNRLRGKAGQKMTVEHVHVHKGGQAIVGAVSQSNTQNNTKVGK